MKLSTLSLVLGLGFALPQIFGILKPAQFGGALRKFPRSLTAGWILTLLGTAGFLWNLHQESISDFAAYKPAMLIGFGALGVATCIFVQDFLAVRGFAVVLLLIAKEMVDAARWVESDLRIVVTFWAYVMVVAGIWFTVSPWKLRDFIDWANATEQRTRNLSVARLAFGLLVAVLGLTVF